MIDEIIGSFVSSFFGGNGPHATDESIERWRRRPFLLRWLPIVFGAVVIPVGFIALLVYLLVDAF